MAVMTFERRLDNQERIRIKWAALWRSILLSSLEKTLFPYSQFIRVLRLEDLQELLQGVFNVKRVAATLFNGDVTKYRVDKTTKKGNFVVIDACATVNRVAKVITQHSPMLEEFSGHQQLDGSILAESLSKVPQLKTLRVIRGEALEGIGPLLRVHCPSFNTLSFYGWQHPEADQQLADLLAELRPNSLKSFEVHSTSNIGAKSYAALNHHSESLKELKLNDIKPEAVAGLSLLRECTGLQTLLLSELVPGTVDLKKQHKESFQEIIAWLRECRDLRSLTIRNFPSGPALLQTLLTESQIKLTRLEVEKYTMAESKEFHQALAQQPTLQHLSLWGEGSQSMSDNDALVDALCQLGNLTEVRLREVSDKFFNSDITRLARSLSKLEAFWTSGSSFTDEIWRHMAGLKSLRLLEFNALTHFTTSGIVDFVTSLSEGNRGLALVLMMQDKSCDISEDDQTLIKQIIEATLDGSFQIMLWPGKGRRFCVLPVFAHHC